MSGSTGTPYGIIPPGMPISFQGMIPTQPPPTSIALGNGPQSAAVQAGVMPYVAPPAIASQYMAMGIPPAVTG